MPRTCRRQPLKHEFAIAVVGYLAVASFLLWFLYGYVSYLVKQ